MNEEEAIEYLKNYTIWNEAQGFTKGKNDEAIETILNLLETKQAEIEKLKNHNKDLLRKLRNRVKEVKKLEKYSLYKKEFATLNKQLKEKDIEITSLQMTHDYDVKMIDEVKGEAVRLYKEIEKKDKIISNSIIEIENFRQYFSEDLQPDFIRILEILKDKKVIDW